MRTFIDDIEGIEFRYETPTLLGGSSVEKYHCNVYCEGNLRDAIRNVKLVGELLGIHIVSLNDSRYKLTIEDCS